ncbi:MAG: hypothetical protein LBG61_01610 [Burkholderiales bacterium]|jgi:hypothetical protein|nr:hypothetical protein [Burkholderiales bacterium]
MKNQLIILGILVAIGLTACGGGDNKDKNDKKCEAFDGAIAGVFKYKSNSMASPTAMNLVITETGVFFATEYRYENGTRVPMFYHGKVCGSAGHYKTQEITAYDLGKPLQSKYNFTVAGDGGNIVVVNTTLKNLPTRAYTTERVTMATHGYEFNYAASNTSAVGNYRSFVFYGDGKLKENGGAIVFSEQNESLRIKTNLFPCNDDKTCIWEINATPSATKNYYNVTAKLDRSKSVHVFDKGIGVYVDGEFYLFGKSNKLAFNLIAER